MEVYIKLFCIVLTLTLQVAAKKAILARNYALPILTTNLMNALQDESRNFQFSPVVVQTNIGVASSVADSETANELITAFNGGTIGNPNATIPKMGLMRRSTQSTFYIEKTIEMNEALYNNTQKHIGAMKKAFDRTRPSDASYRINSWVERVTKYKIKHLTEEKDITKDINGVFVHSMSYHADWEDNLMETDAGKFWNGTHSYNVEMLKLDPAYLLSGKLENLAAFAVMLPFKEPASGILVLQPVDKNGLNDLVKNLQGIDIADIPIKLKLKRMSLRIPKLLVNDERSLLEPLEKIGVVSAFSKGGSDFTGLLKNGKNSYIKELKQKTYLSVEEKGIDVFSGTSLLWNANSMPNSPKKAKEVGTSEEDIVINSKPILSSKGSNSMKLNHPFVIAVIRQINIFFVGCIRNPQNKVI